MVKKITRKRRRTPTYTQTYTQTYPQTYPQQGGGHTTFTAWKSAVDALTFSKDGSLTVDSLKIDYLTTSVDDKFKKLLQNKGQSAKWIIHALCNDETIPAKIIECLTVNAQRAKKEIEFLLQFEKDFTGKQIETITDAKYIWYVIANSTLDMTKLVPMLLTHDPTIDNE